MRFLYHNEICVTLFPAECLFAWHSNRPIGASGNIEKLFCESVSAGKGGLHV